MDSLDTLTLEYKSHDDDVLYVTVRASNGQFSGSATPWVEPGVLSWLARSLRDFPDVTPIECQLGLNDLDHVILTFYTRGRARHAWIRVQIFDDQQQSADLLLRTDSAVLDRSSKGLRRLECRKQGVVSLT